MVQVVVVQMTKKAFERSSPHAGEQTLVVGDVKLDVDRGAGVLLVLDFGLGQGGAALGAPVNRLHAPVDHPFFSHLAEDPDLLRLKFRL